MKWAYRALMLLELLAVTAFVVSAWGLALILFTPIPTALALPFAITMAGAVALVTCVAHMGARLDERRIKQNRESVR